MKKNRIRYIILLLLIIFLGIMSRKTTLIPLNTGDFLYAVMLYVLIRILLINKKSYQIAILSLLLCYGIEFLQLYQENWMTELRKTLLGKYVLGQGFLWSDIFFYTLGTATAFSTEKVIFKKRII